MKRRTAAAEAALKAIEEMNKIEEARKSKTEAIREQREIALENEQKAFNNLQVNRRNKAIRGFC